MLLFGLIASLVVCFAVLGKAADMLVVHIKKIGERLGIGVFFLGLLLGLFTSFPELALGISAYAGGIPALSLGNLIGGIPVLLGLILGLSVMLNRQVKTGGVNGGLIFSLAYLALPLVLGLDGRIGMIDGVVLILFYLLLVYMLYAWHRTKHGTFVRFIHRRKVLKDLFLTVFSVIAVLLVSNLIVRLTLQLLGYFDVPAFIVGLLIFAIGTNLPEIVVTFRSWRRGIAELSVSHLLGSAIVNPLLIGIFSFMRTTDLRIGAEYYVLLASYVLLLIFVFIFARSQKRLTRGEGGALLALYLVYLFGQTMTARL